MGRDSIRQFSIAHPNPDILTGEVCDVTSNASFSIEFHRE